MGKLACNLMALALLWSAASLARAEFRCDTDLIGRGMTPQEVLERCGLPEYEQGWTDYRYPGFLVRVDEWSYHLGINRFRRLLTFENGRLIRVELRDKPLNPTPPERF